MSWSCLRLVLGGRSGEGRLLGAKKGPRQESTYTSAALGCSHASSEQEGPQRPQHIMSADPSAIALLPVQINLHFFVRAPTHLGPLPCPNSSGSPDKSANRPNPYDPTPIQLCCMRSRAVTPAPAAQCCDYFLVFHHLCLHYVPAPPPQYTPEALHNPRGHAPVTPGGPSTPIQNCTIVPIRGIGYFPFQPIRRVRHIYYNYSIICPTGSPTGRTRVADLVVGARRASLLPSLAGPSPD